jgi:hypothetical protein
VQAVRKQRDFQDKSDFHLCVLTEQCRVEGKPQFALLLDRLTVKVKAQALWTLKISGTTPTKYTLYPMTLESSAEFLCVGLKVLNQAFEHDTGLTYLLHGAESFLRS